MKGSPSFRASRSPSPSPSRLMRQTCVPGSRSMALRPPVASRPPPSMLGKGQFSIYLPRRVDSEYYVKSPVKVKAEMFLCPEHLGAGGVHSKNIPCSASAEKLTEDNRFGIVNVPIKIEAEVLLSPGINYSCRTTTPLNAETDRSQCTVRIIEPDERPYETAESWQSWGSKGREVMSKCQATHRFQGENSPSKQIMVEELKLDDNCKRTKDLRKQLTSYLDQVSEQNKKMQKLQDRLREEESKVVDSSEKIQVAEQQFRVSEQKLKAAECRAKVAEHRAEAIKQRTKVLSVSCGYQGVQLKDLARQVELFVRNLEAQRMVALDSNKILKQQSPRAPDAGRAGDGQFCTTSRTRHLQSRHSSSEIQTGARENSPDLNSPSTDCFYQTVTVQELSDKYVMFLCRRSPVDQQQRLQLEHEKTQTRSSPTLVSSLPLVFPPMHAEVLLNQLLQMAPNWHREFESSMQRAGDLIKKCSTQALKLRDLSRELDCFPSTTRIEAVQHTGLNPSKGKVKFVEDDVTPSPQSTPLSEARFEHTLPLHTNVAHQTNRCLEKYLFNLAEAAEALVPAKKAPQVDIGLQTPSEPPLKQETCPLPVNPRKLLHMGFFPYRYEVKAWRIAFRMVVQGMLLWLGLLLLPEVHFCYLPPPT